MGPKAPRFQVFSNSNSIGQALDHTHRAWPPNEQAGDETLPLKKRYKLEISQPITSRIRLDKSPQSVYRKRL